MMQNPNSSDPHAITWWQQGWRSLWRDARAGELRLLVVAVVLGVAALSSVSFLADRLNAGLQRDASQLLGGDVVVVFSNGGFGGIHAKLLDRLGRR